MTLIHVIVLAIIQGLTEFIPVSSSAHLILPSQLLENWPDQGIDFDIAVHVGTLLAVIIFYRNDIFKMVKSFVTNTLKLKFPSDEYGKMAYYVLLATIPVGIAGILLKDYIEVYARDGKVIALTTILFGILLYLAQKANDRHAQKNAEDKNLTNDTISKYNKLTIKGALVVGLSQMLAIIPGTSRSGITLTAGYFLGISPAQAAKFSFLLSIPTIAASALLALKDFVVEQSTVPASYIVIAMGVSFVTAYIVIKLFLELLNKLGLLPYVIYRIILGLFLLYVFW